MKKYRWMLSLTVLALAALACNAMMGGGSETPLDVAVPADEPTARVDVPTLEAPAEPEATDEYSTEEDDYSYGGGDAAAQSEFPLPEDASNLMVLGEAGTNFQTGMKVDEAIEFYRDAFGDQGLKERPILTVISDTMFSMVFDGHSSGKAVVIQGVDLGGGTLNINIRLEEVP